MQANETKVLDFLRRPIQFTIPPEQEIEGWAVHCSDIWGALGRGRFSSSVVYFEGHKGLCHNPTQKLQVLLGHRFLLMVSIFIAALGKAIDAKGGIEVGSTKITAKTLSSFYLFNEGEDGLARYKILPSEDVKDSFLWLLEKKSLSRVTSRNMAHDFKFFVDKLKGQDERDLRFIYNQLCQLTFFEVRLEDSLHRTDLLHRLICVGREIDDCWNAPCVPNKQAPGEGGHPDNRESREALPA